MHPLEYEFIGHSHWNVELSWEFSLTFDMLSVFWRFLSNFMYALMQVMMMKKWEMKWKTFQHFPFFPFCDHFHLQQNPLFRFLCFSSTLHSTILHHKREIEISSSFYSSNNSRMTVETCKKFFLFRKFSFVFFLLL